MDFLPTTHAVRLCDRGSLMLDWSLILFCILPPHQAHNRNIWIFCGPKNTYTTLWVRFKDSVVALWKNYIKENANCFSSWNPVFPLPSKELVFQKVIVSGVRNKLPPTLLSIYTQKNFYMFPQIFQRNYFFLHFPPTFSKNAKIKEMP